MGSYITGILVAFCIVLGLYFSMELSIGNPVFAQDTLETETEDQLRRIAENFKSEDQIEAIVQLGDRPGDLSKTIPVLATLATVQNELVRNAADLSLETIGSPGVEHLKPFMEQDTTRGYRIACSGMKSIGPGCEIYLKDIKRLLVSDEPMRRRCGLYALQGMGDAGKSAMQEIISCVSDMDLNNQCSACRVLESYGTDAIDAEEALLKLFHEGGPSTRGWAAVCLGAIGPTSSDVNVAELLTERLANNANARPLTPTEQERILIGLAHLGPEASGAVDVVLEKMNGKNKYVSGHAAYAHWKITGDSTKALAKLKELLAISHHQSDAMFLISKMGPEAASLAKGVGRGLGSAEAGTREQASIALGNMGASANEFLDELENRKKDKDALVRVAARRAIAQIKDDVKELEEKNSAKPNKG